jgi:hypothetical protein
VRRGRLRVAAPTRPWAGGTGSPPRRRQQPPHNPARPRRTGPGGGGASRRTPRQTAEEDGVDMGEVDGEDAVGLARQEFPRGSGRPQIFRIAVIGLDRAATC